MENFKNQSPASIVITTFGSLRAVASALDLQHTTPRLWERRGFVPSIHHRPLLLAAKKRGLKLTESDLIWGR